MKVNYFGTLNAVKAVLPSMRARKSGRIVCVNSVLGFMSVYGYAAYSASKYAMRGMIETLHQENYPYGISCSLIASGSIGSKTFFEEEQRVKPEITKLIEADDYVSKPE
jgi:3-dehydrosphinganine reductase